MVQILEQCRGHGAFQGLPDVFYRIELRTIGRQENEMDVQGGGLFGHRLGMMELAIIEYHQYRQIGTAFTSDILEEGTHVRRLRRRRE